MQVYLGFINLRTYLYEENTANFTGRSGVPADCSGNANGTSSKTSEPVIIPPQDNTVFHQ